MAHGGVWGTTIKRGYISGGGRVKRGNREKGNDEEKGKGEEKREGKEKGKGKARDTFWNKESDTDEQSDAYDFSFLEPLHHESSAGDGDQKAIGEGVGNEVKGEMGVGEGVGGDMGVGEEVGGGQKSGRRRVNRRVDTEGSDALTGLEGVRERKPKGVGFGEQGGVRMLYQVAMGEVNVCMVEM